MVPCGFFWLQVFLGAFNFLRTEIFSAAGFHHPCWWTLGQTGRCLMFRGCSGLRPESLLLQNDGQRRRSWTCGWFLGGGFVEEAIVFYRLAYRWLAWLINYCYEDIILNRIPVWFFSVWTDSPNFLMFFLADFGRVLALLAEYTIFQRFDIWQLLIPDLKIFQGGAAGFPCRLLKPNCLFFQSGPKILSRRESFFSRLSFFGFQRGKEIFNFETALPSLKRTVRTRKLGHPERKRSYSNHPFSGEMLVSGRVNDRWKGLELGEFRWSIWEQVHYILKQRRAWRNLPKMDN